MVKKADALCTLIEKGTFAVVAGLLALMLVVAWAHVFSRYVLGSSLFWSEELLRYSLVWFALLSASLLFRRKRHLGIALFVEKLPESAQNTISVALVYMFLIVNVVVTVQGFDLLGRVHSQLTPALRIPMSLPYASVPVSFLFMSLYALSDMLHQFMDSPSSLPTAKNRGGR
jgi:TRAP-type C4-dicarboxylate transport system permease small subunit